MKKIFLLSFLFLPFFSQAYYYGYQGYSSTPYPGGIPAGTSVYNPPKYQNYNTGSSSYDDFSDSHKKYLQDKIKTFCTPSVYNEERCKRYCDEAGNNSALCGVKKPTVDVAELERKKQEEERKRLEEEKRRQELEKKENEIKEQANNIFQNEFENKNQERIEKINKIENQSKVKTFFIGSDDRTIDELRNEKIQIEAQIIKLNKILSETTSDDNKSLIQEKISLFENKKSEIERVISENETRTGIFGWVKNIFKFN